MPNTKIATGPESVTGIGPPPRSTEPSTVESKVSISFPVPSSWRATFRKHLWIGSLRSIPPGGCLHWCHKEPAVPHQPHGRRVTPTGRNRVCPDSHRKNVPHRRRRGGSASSGTRQFLRPYERPHRDPLEASLKRGSPRTCPRCRCIRCRRRAVLGVGYRFWLLQKDDGLHQKQ